MTNLEKMNELVGASATKEEIKSWAYNNRIHVMSLHLDEEKFETMEKSVDRFLDSGLYGDDEHENWSNFLDSEYVE